MSEFKCPEPGCDYHVGISNGPNLTAEDWESEQYYFQEIEDHQQMHEQSREVATSEVSSRLRAHWLRADVDALADPRWSIVVMAVLILSMAVAFLTDLPLAQLVFGLVGPGAVVWRLAGICLLARRVERDLVWLVSSTSIAGKRTVAADGYLRAGRNG